MLELAEILLKVLILLFKVVLQPLFLPDDFLCRFELHISMRLLDLMDKYEVPSCYSLSTLTRLTDRLNIIDYSLYVLDAKLVQFH